MSLGWFLKTTLRMVLLIFLLYSESSATNQYYTVQLATYSLSRQGYAVSFLEKIKRSLKETEDLHLRVDRSERYLIVRAGRYDSLKEAMELWQRLRSIVPDAFLVRVRHPERYRQVYPEVQPDSNREPPGPSDDASDTPERKALRETEPSVFYTVQLGSFLKLSDATEEFERIKNSVPSDMASTLTLERRDRYYTIRIGRFNTYAQARAFLDRYADILTGVIIVMSDRAPVESVSENVISATPAQGGIRPAEKQLKGLLSSIDLLVEQRQYGRAAELLRQAMAEEPDNAMLHARYGEVLLRMGYPDRAYKEYKKAVELSPDIAEFHTGLGYSLLNSHIDRAKDSIRVFKKALEIAPDDVSALEGLGIVYVSINRIDLAMEIHQRLKELDPEAADRLYDVIVSGIDWGVSIP